MATITSLSETGICNMALGRIGAKRINSIEDATDEKVEAIQCRLHYSLTRDSLIRSHWWRMARARATLSANADYTSDGEFTYAYDLPVDFLRMKMPYEGEVSNILRYTYSLEGTQLLSNESPMKIRYIKRVTDPPSYDPLFIEVFVLTLAMKLIMPLSGAGKESVLMRNELNIELQNLMAKVRTIDKQETNTTGRTDMSTWNDARVAGTGNAAKRYS